MSTASKPLFVLYIVPTPIGNLEDITLRALRLLKEAEIIICEDSRETRKLMNLLEIINKPKFVDITRSHNFNRDGIAKVLNQLMSLQADVKHKKSQKNIASIENEVKELKVLLVSDSGMPGISDPGKEVVAICIQSGVEFTVLPGASALVPAVVGSGFLQKEFEFLGFLPIKKGRQTLWKEIKHKSVPVVLYESSHRIQKFLEEIGLYLESSRSVCVYNDISKFYEKTWRFEVGQAALQNIPAKGEFVIVIDSQDEVGND